MSEWFRKIPILDQMFSLNWDMTSQKPKDSITTNNCVL